MIVTFMGLELEANEDVLVPRQETELLARTAIELLPADAEARVVDMCCGSGNLACAIAAARPKARIFACDLTDACVALTKKNVSRLGFDARIAVLQGDLYRALGEEREIDLIVCNPPYISTGRLENESAHLLEGQPREAFDAGPFGIAIQARLIKGAPGILRPGGRLALEIGAGQQKQVERLFAKTGTFETAQVRHDPNGEARVLCARLP